MWEIFRPVFIVLAFMLAMTVLGFLTQPEKTAQSVGRVLKSLSDTYHQAEKDFHSEK